MILDSDEQQQQQSKEHGNTKNELDYPDISDNFLNDNESITDVKNDSVEAKRPITDLMPIFSECPEFFTGKSTNKTSKNCATCNSLLIRKGSNNRLKKTEAFYQCKSKKENKH